MKLNVAAEEEAARLNKIITVLLEQLDHLKKENSDLRYAMELNLKNISAIKVDDGLNLKNTSAVKVDDGLNLKNSSAVRVDDGLNLKNPSAVKVDDGLNLKNSSTVRVDEGLNLKNSSAVRVDEGPILIGPANISKLARQLAPLFHNRIRRASLRGMANELLTLYNAGYANSEELRKAVNLSVSGFSKHFTMLKRRNFIYKQGIKKYALTAYSVELINKALGKS